MVPGPLGVLRGDALEAPAACQVHGVGQAGAGRVAEVAGIGQDPAVGDQVQDLFEGRVKASASLDVGWPLGKRLFPVEVLTDPEAGVLKGLEVELVENLLHLTFRAGHDQEGPTLDERAVHARVVRHTILVVVDPLSQHGRGVFELGVLHGVRGDDMDSEDVCTALEVRPERGQPTFVRQGAGVRPNTRRKSGGRIHKLGFPRFIIAPAAEEQA